MRIGLVRAVYPVHEQAWRKQMTAQKTNNECIRRHATWSIFRKPEQVKKGAVEVDH